MTITAYQLAKQMRLSLRPFMTANGTNIDPDFQVIKAPKGSTVLTEFLQKTNLFENAQIIEGSVNRIAVVNSHVFAKATFTQDDANHITLGPDYGTFTGPEAISLDKFATDSTIIAGHFGPHQDPKPTVSFGAKSPGPQIPGWDLPALPKKPVVESKSDKFNLWGKFDVD